MRTLLVLGMIGALMLVGAPATASTAGAAEVRLVEVTAATTNAVAADPPAPAGDLYWFRCLYHSERTAIIILRFPRAGVPISHASNCVLGGEYGFVALITHSATSHTVKVCNQTVVPFTGRVNPARPDGGATGDVIPYTDQPGGGCNAPTVSYPIRKFRADWDAYVSPWMAPY